MVLLTIFDALSVLLAGPATPNSKARLKRENKENKRKTTE